METKTLLQSLLHVAWCLEPFECYMHLNILFPEDFLMLQCYNKWFLEFMLSIYSYSGINLSNLPLRLGSCLCKAPAVVLGLGKPNLAFCILHGPSLWQVLSNGGSVIVLKNEHTPYWALWLNSHIKLCWALYSLFVEKKKNRTTLNYHVHTLWSYGAVKSISIYENTFLSTSSMCLEHINSLDWVFSFSFVPSSFDCHDGIDNHLTKEVRCLTNQFWWQRCLCYIYDTFFAQLINIDSQVLLDIFACLSKE